MTPAISPVRGVLLVSGVVLLAAGAGCAATPVLPPQPPPQPKVEAPPPPPDVSAVPAPDNLFLLAHLADTAKAIKIVTEWGHLPPLDASLILAAIAEGVTDTKDNAAVASVIDPSGSVDFAASFVLKAEPEPFLAFGAAIKDIESAKSSLAASFEAIQADNGVIRLNPRKAGKAGAESFTARDEKGACEIAPAAGPAAFRLVCGSSPDALTALAPYLTRTLPREASPTDLHVELRAAPIASFATLGRAAAPAIIAKVLSRKGVGTPGTVDLVNAVVGDVADFLGDLDTVTLDAALEPQNASVAMRTTYRSSTSLLTRLGTGHPERADVPPLELWQVPGDVDLAYFGVATDEADLAHPRDLVLTAVDEQLARTKLAAADRGAVRDLVARFFHTSGGLAAHGMDGDASYWLFENSDTPPHADKVVRDLVSVWNRPGIARWVKAELPAEVKLPTIHMGAPVAGLPKGTIHLEIVMPPVTLPATSKEAKGQKSAPAVASGPRPAPETLHFIMAPAGSKRWSGMSASLLTIRTKLAAVLSQSAASSSLGAQPALPGLEGFRETRMGAGGFVTIRSFMEMLRQSVKAQLPSKAAVLDGMLRRLPAKGSSPVVLTSIPGAPTPAAPGGVHDVHLTIPAGAVRDAVWLGLQVGAGAGD